MWKRLQIIGIVLAVFGLGFDDTDHLNAARRQSVPANHANISLTPPHFRPGKTSRYGR